MDTDTKYQKYYESKIPVAVVNEIEDEVFKNNRQIVIDEAKRQGVTLKEYQIDALTDFLYRGDPISSAISAYKQYGISQKTRQSAYGFNYGSRGDRRWILFSTGKYTDASGNEIKVSSTSGNSSIISKAKEIHNYMSNNKYQYCDGGSSCGNHSNGHGLNGTFEKSKIGYHNVCCATYVSWVLQDTKHISASEHTNGATPLYSLLKGKKWKEVNGVSNAQPGDIFFYSRDNGKKYYHTDIYAGNNKVWNAGNTNDIQSKNTTSIYSTPYKILRAP